ncbi:LemA family protein [bacterium]|nr:LemA family protein [bacterium]
MPFATLLLLALVALVVFGGIGIYNRLVGLRVRAEGAWSDIDVQLKRRHDLVDNLVETVKGYAAHERVTLEAVTKARQQAAAVGGRGGDPAGSAAAESFLTQQLRQLFALAEAYPDLKANQNFQDLQRALQELEEAIQNARRYYNAVVRDFNTRLKMFPDLIFANLFGFSERKFFELTEPGEAEAPKVSFTP